MTCWRTLPPSVGSISPSPVTTFGLLSGPSLGSGPYAMFAPRSGCRPLKRAVLNKSSGDPADGARHGGGIEAMCLLFARVALITWLIDRACLYVLGDQ